MADCSPERESNNGETYSYRRRRWLGNNGVFGQCPAAARFAEVFLEVGVALWTLYTGLSPGDIVGRIDSPVEVVVAR